MIYPGDHSPAHVHVVGPGWVVVVTLIGMAVREVIHADQRTAREVLRQIKARQDALPTGCRRFHG